MRCRVTAGQETTETSRKRRAGCLADEDRRGRWIIRMEPCPVTEQWVTDTSIAFVWLLCES